MALATTEQLSLHQQREFDLVPKGERITVTVIPHMYKGKKQLRNLTKPQSQSNSDNQQHQQQQKENSHKLTQIQEMLMLAQEAKINLPDYISELEQIKHTQKSQVHCSESIHLETLGGCAAGIRLATDLGEQSYTRETLEAALSSIHVDILRRHREQPPPQRDNLSKTSSFQHSRSQSSDRMGYIHPHVSPVWKVVESPTSFYIISPDLGLDLHSAIYSCPRMLKTFNHRLFLVYQMLHALNFFHLNGLVHGSLTPHSIFFQDNLPWIRFHGFGLTPRFSLPPSSARLNSSAENDLCDALLAWKEGRLSNLDYILFLNRAAGRRLGDPNRHPVVPWCIDFVSPTSWRDMTQSKFRLTKGDMQLDITFGSEDPHHVTDILTDLTYYSYLARRTPIPVLQRYVRPQFVPREYPDSMQRMYSWSPD